MRKFTFAALATLLIVGSVSAQEAPWRLVQGSDGILFVIRGDVKHRIVPAAMTDADMAIPEAAAWEDGTMTVASAPPAAPAAVPPAPAPATGKRIGETTVLTMPSGLRLAITAHGITDPVQSSNRANNPSGRWVLIDWSIKNEGTIDFDPGYSDFKLQTMDGFLVQRGNAAGHQRPQLDTARLAPGQQARGYLVYDVPAGQVIKSLIYQPIGGRQFVIAELP